MGADAGGVHALDADAPRAAGDHDEVVFAALPVPVPPGPCGARSVEGFVVGVSGSSSLQQSSRWCMGRGVIRT